MIIPQTVEYALRAMVWLASRPTDVQGTAAIARGTQVPAGYLSKVLQELSHHGLVISTAGRRGGFRLTRPAANVSVLDVVNAVAPLERIRQCPLKLKTHRAELCPLHRRLDEAIATMEKAFAATAIAELLAPLAGESCLCEDASQPGKETDASRAGKSPAGLKPGGRRSQDKPQPPRPTGP